MNAMSTVFAGLPAPGRAGRLDAPPHFRREVPPGPFRVSKEEYRRLADEGHFAGRRVELIEGEIVDMGQQSELHYAMVAIVVRVLERCFGPGFWVRPAGPLALTPASDPEPDAAVVPGDPRQFAAAGEHPASALLVVEVSLSSLDYDQNVKAGLYAKAGARDYWIVNLCDNTLEVRRNPVADASRPLGWTYSEVTTLSPGESIAPLAKPGSPVAVSDLLP